MFSFFATLFIELLVGFLIAASVLMIKNKGIIKNIKIGTIIGYTIIFAIVFSFSFGWVKNHYGNTIIGNWFERAKYDETYYIELYIDSSLVGVYPAVVTKDSGEFTIYSIYEINYEEEVVYVDCDGLLKADVLNGEKMYLYTDHFGDASVNAVIITGRPTQ